MTPSDIASDGEGSEALGPLSPLITHTRSQSISSDRPSMNGYGGLLSPPSMTNPEPIYIAASAASQIVTNDHDSRSDTWLDQHGIEPSGETALVASGALKLVNSFLDQLLFNFLSLARSTSLASLRPAVSEVLKPKLAKDAITLADGELHEYLGGGEDEELLAFHNGLEPSGDWDLELVWKRTRLRCMVYSSLGDMEEEDEDHYTELEQLDGPPGRNNRFSNNPGVVSPAVAIFLTSILEFMGEQALVIAGQAAYHRLHAKHEKEERQGTSTHGDIADRVVVDEMDMEKVALDRTLGRLWRGWKKRIRSPTASMSMARSFSRESLFSRSHSRKVSAATEPIRAVEDPAPEEVPAEQPLEEPLRKPSTTESLLLEHASTVPLPIYDNDIREIEIPGLAAMSDDEDESSEDVVPERPRPKSLMLPRNVIRESATPQPSKSQTLISQIGRKRSNSLPSPIASMSFSYPNRVKAAEIAAPTEETEVPGSEVLLDETSDHKDAAEPTEDATEHVEGLGIQSESSTEPDAQNHGGVLAGMLAGAAAAGAVAVAGITAVAKGKAPETLPTPGEDSDLEEAFIEEPKVMTSSRVSVHGRISPDHPLRKSRPGSIHAPSIHSVRLVDVPSPRSPTRSRHGSVGSMDQITGTRPAVSRSSSLHSPIIPSEAPIARDTSPVLRAGNASPLARNPSSLSTRQARNSASASISELEEQESSPPRSIPFVPVVVPERSPLREALVPASHDEYGKLEMSANTPSFGEPEFLHTSVTRSPREAAIIQARSVSILSDNSPRTPETGVPPLTPLREMMEGAPDTSDEASSIAPSYIARSEVTSQSPVPSVPRESPIQRLAELSKPTEQAKPSRSAAAERSRASPTQIQREDDVTPKPRQHHTSSSSTSSGSAKLRPIRTSEDSMPRSATDDKGKSFEQLIRSDQTLQYTLTPQNVRQIEVFSPFSADC